MSFESSGNKQLGMAEVMAEIHSIMQEVSAMGANDVEFSSLQRIQSQLMKNEITVAVALEQARGVRDSKQDYH